MAQALAVYRIYDSGRTVRDLAELLDLSQRAVGRLLDRARSSKDGGASRRPAAEPSVGAPSSHAELARRHPADDGSDEQPALAGTAAPGRAEASEAASDGDGGGAMVPTWSVDGTPSVRG